MDITSNKLVKSPGNLTRTNVSPYNLIRDSRIFLDIPKYTLIDNLPKIPTDFKYNDSLKGKLPLLKDLTLLKITLLEAVHSKQKSDGGLNEEDIRLKFIQCSLICKMIILSTSSLSLPSLVNNTDTQEHQLLYMLWEIHLVCLMMANDLQCLSIARHESIKLSREIYKLANILNKTRSTKDSFNSSDNISTRIVNSSGFPENCPLSLQLIIIRLRTNGPNLNTVNELYQVLYKLRRTNSLNQHDSFIISLNVTANLIGKNHYLTFLTLADNMICSYEDQQSNPKCLEFKNFYLLLSCLVYLMLKKFELAEFQFNKLELSGVDNGSSMGPLRMFSRILKSVTPILDNENLLSLIPLKESEINFRFTDEPSQMEKNFEVLKKLYENGRITGRILCCYCGLLEVQLKSCTAVDYDKIAADGNQILQVNDNICDELKNFYALLIQGWFTNVKGVYGFE